MATYKPIRKTDSGVEEVLLPISAIEGLEEALNQGGGGGSSPSVSQVGTWQVIDEPEIPQKDLPLEFTSNGGSYMAIGGTSIGSSSWGINALSYQRTYGAYDTIYTNNPSGSYGITHGWSNDGYRYITVTKEPTDAGAIAWLNNNTDAPKVKVSEETMPQIRFTSANGGYAETSTFRVDEDNPLKLTVEITSGKLQVGDALQVCVRKRFNGCRANNYKRKYKLQKFEEYVVTEEDLDRKYLTVVISSVAEGDKGFRGLFRDGNTTGLSPIYLRIRRPKGDLQMNDSGQTVDASFSNIVTVWKNYHRGEQVIRIY